jgi:hypothetical protein
MSGYECKPSRKMQEVQLQFSVLDLIKHFYVDLNSEMAANTGPIFK